MKKARTKPFLVTKYKKKKAFEKEQEVLREKHHIEDKDKDKIIVEKKSATKYFVLGVSGVVRTIATIIILLFAITGVFSIAYEKTRNDLIELLPINTEESTEVTSVLSYFNNN